MTEKILAKGSERRQLSPGENVWVNVDVLMTHDVCGPGSNGVFYKEFGASGKVWDREKVVIIPDHNIFTTDWRANRNAGILRDFSTEQNIKYFYDIKDRGDFQANPNYRGVSLWLLPKKAIAGQGRSWWVQIRRHVRLEHLVSLLPELEILMQVSCWVLERFR